MKVKAWTFRSAFLIGLFLLVLCPYDGPFPQDRTVGGAESGAAGTGLEEPADEQAADETFDEFDWGEEEQPGEAVTEEAFSLYGYLTNLFQSGFRYERDRFAVPTYGDMLYLRLKGDWKPEQSLQFHVELAYYGRFGDQNPYGFLESSGLAVPQSQFPYEDFVHQLDIDHAWALANLGPFDLRFGKLPIAWGTAYLFNPTARVASAGVLDALGEETPGTVGVMPSAYFLDVMAVTGYVAFQDKSHKLFAVDSDGWWDNLPYGLKVQATVGPVDFSAGFLKEVLYGTPQYRREYYISADFDAAVWDIDFYGEAAFHLPQRDSRIYFGDYIFSDEIEVALGAYYTIPFLDVGVRAEYFPSGQRRARIRELRSHKSAGRRAADAG